MKSKIYFEVTVPTDNSGHVQNLKMSIDQAIKLKNELDVLLTQPLVEVYKDSVEKE